MKNPFNVNVGAQGMPARQGKVCLTAKFRAVALLWLFFGATSFQFALAQTAEITWTDLDSFRVGYQIPTSDTLLKAGEPFSVNLYLEMVGAQTCIGGNFDLLWSAGVDTDPDNAYSVPGESWLGASNGLIAAFNGDPNAPRGDFGLVREDGSLRSGSGWVMTVHLITGANDVSTNQVILGLNGSIIPIENLDMKSAAPALPPLVPVSIFPNPFTDRLQVHGSSGGPLQLRLLSLQGHAIARHQMESGHTWSLDAIPSGIYFLEIKQPDQPTQILRVIRQ